MSDDDGYPTAEELKRIESWEPSDGAGLFDFARSIWYWPEWASVLDEFDGEKGRFYRFATGGWSGNESIIEAIGENSVAWILYWFMSKRGGLHVFRLRERL